MNSVRKRISGVVLSALIALAMIAPSLQAGPVAASGQFKLPLSAQWEKVGLQSGDYWFSVDHITANGVICVYRGTQAVGMVRPAEFDSSKDQSKNSELVLVRHDGKVAVRALTLPRVGTFYFSLPQDLKTLVAQQSQTIETIHVPVSGN